MDGQPGSRTAQVPESRRTVLTIGETAALLRVDRREVAAAIARGQLRLIRHEGALLVDGDALWVRLDPLATNLPSQLMEAMGR